MTVYCINNEIMAPLKCGTRYLRSLGLPHTHIHLSNDDWNRAYENIWKLIILRNPLEHLKSALQTELLNLYNGHTLWEGMTTQMVLDRFISKDGCDHWSSNMYEMIYNLWISQSKKSKIVNLNDMSYFVSNMGYHIPFIKKKYDFTNFNIWLSKDTIFEKIKLEYNEYYLELIRLNNLDTYYYNLFEFETIIKKII
jgi:hypothetical protein